MYMLKPDVSNARLMIFKLVKGPGPLALGPKNVLGTMGPGPDPRTFFGPRARGPGPLTFFLQAQAPWLL